jgi:hypothetical protein
MNSDFVGEQAQLLVASPEIQSATQPQQRVIRLYRRVLGRPPTDKELKLVLNYVAVEAARTEPVVVWRFGYGPWDAAGGRLERFSELAHWTGDRWQGSSQYPDPVLHYVSLTADGGHPGSPLAVVRRWTSPVDGAVTIDGALNHPDPHGDGVEALIVSSRHGIVGRWIAEHHQTPTPINCVEVTRGDTIDFVVDPRGNDNYDSFNWAPRLRLLTSDSRPPAIGRSPDVDQTWDAKANFHGPLPPRPDPWACFAQVLLLTNEFIFLD